MFIQNVTNIFMIYDIFVNCNWVVTRWQYTFTHKQYIERYKINNTQNNTTISDECGPCPVLASYTLAFALQPRKKHGKTSVRVAASKNTWTTILKHNSPIYVFFLLPPTCFGIVAILSNRKNTQLQNCVLFGVTEVSICHNPKNEQYAFFSHLSSRCVSINPYNKFIISHTHHIQYNAN